jgi:hypothetical protein
VTNQIIKRRKIEIHLARVFGFEFFHLQINHKQTTQIVMIENQVQIKIFAINFKIKLAADKRKARAQFQQEVFYPL